MKTESRKRQKPVLESVVHLSVFVCRVQPDTVWLFLLPNRLLNHQFPWQLFFFFQAFPDFTRWCHHPQFTPASRCMQRGSWPYTHSYYPSSYGLGTYKTQSRGTQEACNKRVASKRWPDPKSVPHDDSQTWGKMSGWLRGCHSNLSSYTKHCSHQVLTHLNPFCLWTNSHQTAGFF